MDGRSSKSFMHSITLSFSVNPALDANIHSNALRACLCAERLKPNLQMHVMAVRAAVWWEETVEQTLPLVHSSSVSAVLFALWCFLSLTSLHSLVWLIVSKRTEIWLFLIRIKPPDQTCRRRVQTEERLSLSNDKFIFSLKVCDYDYVQ